MLEMKLNSGKFIIDDNNNTHVDDSIEREINDKFEKNKDNQDKDKPNTIKD